LPKIAKAIAIAAAPVVPISVGRSFSVGDGLLIPSASSAAASGPQVVPESPPVELEPVVVPPEPVVPS
jgi:hypothetical protein